MSETSLIEPALTVDQIARAAYFCGYPERPVEIVDAKTNIFVQNHYKLVRGLRALKEGETKAKLLMVLLDGCERSFQEMLLVDQNAPLTPIVMKRIEIFTLRMRVLATFMGVLHGPPSDEYMTTINQGPTKQ